MDDAARRARGDVLRCGHDLLRRECDDCWEWLQSALGIARLRLDALATRLSRVEGALEHEKYVMPLRSLKHLRAALTPDATTEGACNCFVDETGDKHQFNCPLWERL